MKETINYTQLGKKKPLGEDKFKNKQNRKGRQSNEFRPAVSLVLGLK